MGWINWDRLDQAVRLMARFWVELILTFAYVIGFAWAFAWWHGQTFEVLDKESRKLVFCVILWAQLFILLVSDGKVF